MPLLSRYFLRQLVAPFLFGLGALTGVMLISQIAKKFGALVGKGLPWGVIAEVFALSLPFIIAMTIPMAVLLAVLYAFSHLAADNEITAMRASGISVYQILRPVLAWGVLMAALNFVFVDQVLPRTNARLRGLLIDIGRKKPTLELREQVINEVPPSQYFLRAGRIDAATGRLKDVTIYDMGGETNRRIIYADSGQMAYNEGRTDLNLRLYHGSIHQYRPSDPLNFQLTYYRVNDIRVKDVYDELVRNSTETVRGDREMSTCEMLSVIHDARNDERNARNDREELLRSDLRVLLHLPAEPASAAAAVSPRLPAYCGWIDRVQAALTKTAEPASAAQLEDSVRAAGSHRDPWRDAAAGAAARGQYGPCIEARAAAAGSQTAGHQAADHQAAGHQVADRQGAGRDPAGTEAALAGSAACPGRGPSSGRWSSAREAAPSNGPPGRAAACDRARRNSARRARAAQLPQVADHAGAAVQLGAGRDRRRPPVRGRPPGRPVRGRGPQEVVHQLRLYLVRDHRHRAGAPVPARRHGTGVRRRAADLRDPLHRPHRRREPRRPRADLPVGRDVDAEHRAHGHRASSASSA